MGALVQHRVWRHVVAVTALATLAGLTVFQCGIWRDSATLFTHAVACDPEQPTLWHNLGISLRDRGQPGDLERAEAAGRTAIQLQPENQALHFQLGETLEKLGRHDEAAQEFITAGDGPRDFLQGYVRAAQTLVGSHHQDQAVAVLMKAVRRWPGSVDAHYILGTLLANSGRNTEAANEFRTTIQLTPGYAEAHFNQGMMLRRLHRLPEAISEFEEAIRLDSTNPAPRAALAAAQRDLQAALTDGPAPSSRSIPSPGSPPQ